MFDGANWQGKPVEKKLAMGRNNQILMHINSLKSMLWLVNC